MGNNESENLFRADGSMPQPRFSPLALLAVAAAHGAAWLALAGGAAQVPPLTEAPILVSLVMPEPAPVQAVRPPAPPKPSKTLPRPAAKPVASRPVSMPEPQLALPAATAQEVPPVTVAEATPRTEPALTAAAAPPAETTPPAETPPPEPIEQPRFNADYLDNPAPGYPSLSRRLGEQGRVLLRVYVSLVGAPAQVLLHQSSGHARLDETAVETVRRWKFAPARQGGKPVAAWVIVPIQFSLKG